MLRVGEVGLRSPHRPGTRILTALTKAFMQIKEPKIRRGIVQLVQEIADNDRIENGRE
jgi:hypothetical protein